MDFNAEYFAVIFNSMIRMTTPILLVTLSAALCSKVRIFNIGMEGTMLAAAFFSIVANYYTQSVLLSVMAGISAAMLISALIAYCVIKLKASPVVVGMAINTMMGGVTTYLMYLIFKTKGVFTDPSLVSLGKINLPIIEDIPFVGTALANLTVIDYLAFIFAGLLYVFLYKTVVGFRLRAVGINPEAAKSLGTNVARYQFLTVTLSGILTGLGGVLLSMSTVTLFIQDITSGRGYIALAANNLGNSHPVGVLLSSLFFGISQAVGNTLQNTSLKTQLTASIPYIATLVALVLYSVYHNRKKKQSV